MQPQPENTTRTIWIASVLASIVGAAFLFDSEPGLNWPLWIFSASAGVVLSRSSARLPLGRPVTILLAWATVLSLAVAITDNDALKTLVILNDAMLLGLAVLVTGSSQWRSLSVRLIPL